MYNDLRLHDLTVSLNPWPCHGWLMWGTKRCVYKCRYHLDTGFIERRLPRCQKPKYKFIVNLKTFTKVSIKDIEVK